MTSAVEWREAEFENSRRLNQVAKPGKRRTLKEPKGTTGKYGMRR